MAVHPAVAPALDALRALADYQPDSALDLADVLKSLHNTAAEDNVFDTLGGVLRALGTWSESVYESGFASADIVEHLDAAADQISGLGSDKLDWARELTGRFYGSAR